MHLTRDKSVVLRNKRIRIHFSSKRIVAAVPCRSKSLVVQEGVASKGRFYTINNRIL
nr:MAG TPA: hypothetical protein [Caudoviricetes sp.]